MLTRNVIPSFRRICAAQLFNLNKDFQHSAAVRPLRNSKNLSGSLPLQASRFMFANFQKDRKSEPAKDEKIDASASAPDDGSSIPSEGSQITMSDRETQLAEEHSKLQGVYSETLDKYKRSLAETDNVRKRLTRQIDDAKQFGIQSFVKDLLEVSDILTKAMHSVPKEALAEDNPHLKNLFEGLRLTEAQLNKAFSKHGLEKFDPVGEKFDPNEHEALFEAPATGKEPGTIMAVTQTGFKLNQRVIRPARVGVVKG